jgi:hypothetical protein
MRWSDLEPEAGILDALEHAGMRPEEAGQNEKRHWSESFADGCAIAIADEFRRSTVRGKRILPKDLSSGTEPLTPLGSGTKKRIDVTVADPVLGLEIGASLKGFNFKDRNSGNYDKNLTGRLYELADEVRLVHEHLPYAFMVGVFFLPLDATKDKSDRAMSSFAHTVIKLRERTGRLDVSLAGHAPRCDAAFVGLYTIGDEEESYPAGLARFLDVTEAPPRRGRPIVEATLSLGEIVGEIVARATFQGDAVWSDREEDP